MTEASDVLVVGAGPAGSYLAWLLARRGYVVRLVDQAHFPREKVCGGGLSHKTLELLPFDVTPVVQRRVHGALLTYGNRDTVVKDLGPRGGALVVRSEFDDLLREQAVGAGAQFGGGTVFLDAVQDAGGVTASTSRGPIRARYLVGADGVFSAVRRAAFGAGAVAYVAAVEALVTVPADRMARLGNHALFDFGSVPKGYGWIFPKRDHLNVGVFSSVRIPSIRRVLARFMDLYDVLRSPSAVRPLGFSIPVRNRRQQFERGRVLLIGDAGGFAERFYGEGIYYALRSAELAARALTEAFDRPQRRPYTRLVRRALLPDLRYAAINAALFYAMPRFGYYRMVRNAHVNSYFAELIGGRTTPRACFYRTLATMPYWLFSEELEGYEGQL